MTRAHWRGWLVAGLIVAIVAIVTFAPADAAVDLALFERSWVLLPDIGRTATVAAPSAQPLPDAPFLSRLWSRGPPASSIA